TGGGAAAERRQRTRRVRFRRIVGFRLQDRNGRLLAGLLSSRDRRLAFRFRRSRFAASTAKLARIRSAIS
ncbi:MAG: hypothetical protein QM650_07260, partial [Microlunatus sp.]